MNFLTDQERAQLKYQHRHERDGRIRDRIKAVLLNAEAIIKFFKKVEEAYPGKAKIHMFADNAPCHRNKKVKKFLENSKITLHFLPPYSPNLNPIERLWKWLKERVIYNTYYEDFDDFKVTVMGFFALLNTLASDSELGKSLRSRVSDNFRPMGAPAINY